MQRGSWALVFAGVVGWGVAVARPAQAEAPKAGPWEALFEDEGIAVWRREVPGTSLVEFRGRGLVEAPLFRVLSVIRDDSRKPEWMKSCVGAQTIQFKGKGRAVVYNRTGSPAFFISDRDVVLDAKTVVHSGQRLVHIPFSNTEHPRMPPIDGVVRMPKLEGHWKLRQKGPTSIEVEYQVRADPGGSLPKWLVNWVNQKLPFHTIANLRLQVNKPGYDSIDAIVAGSFDWSGFDVPGAAPAAAPTAAPTKTSTAP
jgi:hypothetical protein